MAGKFIHDVRVVSLVKNKKELFGRRYEFVLQVYWSNGINACIYRPHSMFFDFQSVLSEMFGSKEKIPSAPVAKFHWALLGKIGVEKECKAMEEFCQKIIRLPKAIAQAPFVISFFESWGTDARSNTNNSSELFDLAVGKSVIASTPEQGRPASPMTLQPSVVVAEKDDQYNIIANYDAANIGEISLLEGSSVTVIEKNERGWWFVEDETGKQGWAPATYLELYAGAGDVIDDWMPVVDVNGEGETYNTIAACVAENPDELSYEIGERVEVLAKSNYGWWRVRLRGKVGITPATNLQRTNDTCIYQAADTLARNFSISSVNGLYAMIRKAPPRKESVRSRSSSGISQSSLGGSIHSPSLTGKKPSRFVYSAASFSGGKFVIGDDATVTAAEPRQPSAETAHQAPTQAPLSYENVESDSIKGNLGNSFKEKTARTKLTAEPVNGVQSLKMEAAEARSKGESSAHVNRQPSTKRADPAEIEFYEALQDFSPDPKKNDDTSLKKGEIVQLLSADSGWMFVLYLRDGDEMQGWVPESCLERRPDITAEKFGLLGTKTTLRPRPRPRPMPRPRNKPDDPSLMPGSQAGKKVLPQVEVRVESAEENVATQGSSRVFTSMANRPPMPVPLLQDIQKLRRSHKQGATTAPSAPHLIYDEPEQQLYDEPGALRSVYDSEPWYFGEISRGDSEKILNTYGRQQEFLVRQSVRKPGSYALSVKYCYRIRHFPIESTADNKLAIGKLTFDNLMDIVSYYQESPLFYSEHKEPITLGQYFSKDKVPTNERAHLKF